MLSIIVAMGNGNVIGKDNKLIWHIPEDLKRFKRITIGKTIIMGRKTFESLGGLLPHRKHIVLSKTRGLNTDAIKVISDISEIKDYIESAEEHFVIGGQAIYALLMPLASKLYITRIYQDFEGDVFFPEVNEEEWKLVSTEKGIRDEKNDYEYEYLIYERV